MRITTNILGLSAQRSLETTTRALARTMQRLASGSRINSARDDAAGTAIVSGLEAQRRGILQSIRNINDAQVIFSTADGALSTQTDLLQRMRELAIQAANGTLNDQMRGYLETEFQQLYSEFTRITDQTEFGGSKLLDGSFGTKSLQVGARSSDRISFSLPSLQASGVFTLRVTASDGTLSSKITVESLFGQSLMPSVGDINNDGHLDILNIGFAGSTAVGVYLGRGDGTFTRNADLSVPNLSLAGTLGDVNGDGNLDYISGEGTSQTIGVFIGNGNGTFKGRVTYASPSNGTRDVVVADFNEDGRMDILSNDSGSSLWGLFLGNGNGTFQAYQSIAATFNGLGVEAVDVNKDGHIDIVSSSSFSNTVDIQLGNGNGTFATRMTYATGALARDARVGDINNDGKLDIVVCDVTDGTFSVFLGNGNGTFRTRSTVGGVVDTRDLQLVDMNEDGNLDIVSSTYTSGLAGICFGRGDGTFSGMSTYATGGGSYYLATGDFNEDSATDIVTSNLIANNITMLQMTPKYLTYSASVSLSTQSDAEDALDVLNNALDYVNSSRSQIGAFQSRLGFTSSLNDLTAENIASAQSQIRDADYSVELAELVRLQILQQAGLSVLTQTFQNSKLCISLLENI